MLTFSCLDKNVITAFRFYVRRYVFVLEAEKQLPNQTIF